MSKIHYTLIHLYLLLFYSKWWVFSLESSQPKKHTTQLLPHQASKKIIHKATKPLTFCFNVVDALPHKPEPDFIQFHCGKIFQINESTSQKNVFYPNFSWWQTYFQLACELGSDKSEMKKRNVKGKRRRWSMWKNLPRWLMVMSFFNGGGELDHSSWQQM